MMRITVYLTDRTYEQLVSLAGAPVPQLINMTARSLLSFAIRAIFRPGIILKPLHFETSIYFIPNDRNDSPTEETTDKG